VPVAPGLKPRPPKGKCIEPTGRETRKLAVYPFIHIGPITLGTYGLLVATGVLVALFVMRAEFVRRGLAAVDAETVVAITALAGMAGARIYHLMESPREFFADPWPLLFSTMGFAWFGSVIAGFFALVLLARHYNIGMLTMLDAASPAAAIGYGIGRIGCLISGDGDYGTPTNLPWGMSFPNGIVPTTQRVHPTPIYEFLIALGIFWILWRLGGRVVRDARPAGIVFAAYLVLTGAARFLIEFIRINPRSFFGMTNAQAASLASIAAGALLWWSVRGGGDGRATPDAQSAPRGGTKAGRSRSRA
jgi:phosphatidylglycerol:prolipoprotein diacylglycerol transferase